MDWQQITSLLIVAATAVLLIRGRIRRNKRPCGGDCCAEPLSRIRELAREESQTL